MVHRAVVLWLEALRRTQRLWLRKASEQERAEALARIAELRARPWPGLRDEERRAWRVIVVELRRGGPLRTVQRIRARELGGPLIQLWVAFASPSRGPAARVFNRVLVVLGPGLLCAYFLVATTELLADDDPYALGVLIAGAIIGALAAGAAAYALALRHTRGSVLRLVGGWSKQDLYLWGMLVVLLPTTGFATVTAVLVHEELIGATGSGPGDGALVWKAAETYLWHLAEAIPILAVPGTLDWNPKLELTSSTGGALILAYKCLLLLPLIQLAAIGLKRSFGEMERKPEPAAG